MPPVGLVKIFRLEINTNDNPHYILFVETGRGGAGQTFQVKRVKGREDMVFERDFIAAPGIRSFSTYKGQQAIRSVRLDCLDQVEEVCRGVPRPVMQYNARGACNCKNWLIDAADALRVSGLVLPLEHREDGPEE